MKCKAFGYALLTILFFLSSFVYGAIPARERDALIALYNSTNGDNWTNNDGWKTPPLHSDGFALPGTEGTWHGIIVEDNQVVSIDFLSNNLNGTIPSQLADLAHLGNLSLSNNPQLTGNIPPIIGNMTGLHQLILAHNQLSGSIPVELGNLSNLIYLSLATNQLTGSIPTELSNLLNLKTLRLDSNQLTGSIPAVLGNMTQLEELFLLFNQLTGTIPPELGNLANLRHLYLYKNQLSGSIPSTLGNLLNLTSLSLESNQLTGDIPPELGNLENLQDLRLRNNNLTNIPQEIGNLTELQTLYLGYNKFTGTIPSELGNLTNLEELRINNNQLIGPIPTTLTNLINLSSPHVDFGYNCLYTDDAELRAWLDSVDPDWESHQSECSSISPGISVNRQNLNFGYVIGGESPLLDSFTISNSGEGTLNWSVSSGTQWISLTPVSGVNSGIVEVTVNPAGLTPGTYKGIIFVSDPLASNSPQEVETNLSVLTPSESLPPFGEFSTPIDGSTVNSSAAVTGWVLDDTGVESVKIYREEVSNLVYIGAAVFVEGARPDVESAYPDYPMNYKAGWGYMMLTNFFPNGGNGTFKIHAIATDKEGRTTTLGIKTIHVDNANAVKPFGAIDTPIQGGTASGSQFINWGWVLTPPPNSIPIDGSTINVIVDGVNIGHPTYNNFRADIANLFPDYANSNGAVGYFYLDTTAYENGVHTIQWTAKDSAGNTDGIGSRFFMIENTGSSRQRSMVNGHLSLVKEDLSTIPVDHFEPIKIKKGYDDNKQPQEVYPDDKGIIYIEIKELERLEIHLDDHQAEIEVEEKRKDNLKLCAGYLVIDNELRRLPIGTTFDTGTGTFYWNPGPGFLGEYEFVFVKAEGNDRERVRVKVKIVPKH